MVLSCHTVDLGQYPALVGLVEEARYVEPSFLRRAVSYNVEIDVVFKRVHFALSAHELHMITQLTLDYLALLDVADSLIIDQTVLDRLRV